MQNSLQNIIWCCHKLTLFLIKIINMSQRIKRAQNAEYQLKMQSSKMLQNRTKCNKDFFIRYKSCNYFQFQHLCIGNAFFSEFITGFERFCRKIILQIIKIFVVNNF